jgi:hypothetical protein
VVTRYGTCRPAPTFVGPGAKCYVGPGHKHYNKHKGEKIKFIHIGYKSNTVVYHKKLKRRKEFKNTHLNAISFMFPGSVARKLTEYIIIM